MRERVLVNGIHDEGKIIGDDHFFEEAPEHQFKTGEDVVGIEDNRSVKLMEEILRAFDGAGDLLRIEEDVERIDAEVAFGALMAAIHLDGVTHGLERVEGQANREEDVQEFCVIAEAERGGEAHDFFLGEIGIFEEGQHADVGDEADDEIKFAAEALGGLDEKTGDVINEDEAGEHQNVFGHERHVEIATGQEEQGPAKGGL